MFVCLAALGDLLVDEINTKYIENPRFCTIAEMRNTKQVQFLKVNFRRQTMPKFGKPTNLGLNRQNPATK